MGIKKWAVAVSPLMPPPDHPDLNPIWRAAAEHDSAIAHRREDFVKTSKTLS
jgi:hypothetical protein